MMKKKKEYDTLDFIYMQIQFVALLVSPIGEIYRISLFSELNIKMKTFLTLRLFHIPRMTDRLNNETINVSSLYLVF